MDLTCELAPGYLAAVYEIMSERLESGDLQAIEERLDQIEWSPAELDRRVEEYEELHQQVVTAAPDLYEHDDPVTVDWRALLPVEHAAVASWILVGELGTGRFRSYDFHIEVRDRASRRQTSLGHICCWVLGKPVLPWAMPPSVPALEHPMSAVMRAYEGLLQHLEKLESEDVEIPITSIIWRVGALTDGIVEAKTDDETLHRRLGQLRGRVTPILTAGEQRPMDSLVDNLARKRNVLTHLHPDSEMTFESVVDLHSDLSSVIDHVAGITLSTFFSIAEHHADRPPPRGEVRKVEDDLAAMISTLA